MLSLPPRHCYVLPYEFHSVITETLEPFGKSDYPCERRRRRNESPRRGGIFGQCYLDQMLENLRLWIPLRYALRLNGIAIGRNL